MKGEHIGEFEELLLLSVTAIEPPVYAVPIQRFVARTTGRDVAMGAVYAALDRLEQKGLLRSSFGEATAARGGKRKRLFAVTPTGMRTLRQLRLVRERIWRLIEERS
jgi:PadR family transcriptional regulator, regulatory protein PadR